MNGIIINDIIYKFEENVRDCSNCDLLNVCSYAYTFCIETFGNGIFIKKGKIND